jgi:hypothetical protein
MKLTRIARTCFVLAFAIWALPKAAGPAHAGAKPDAGSQTYYLFVFDNAVAGRDAEYDHWLDSQHVPDMLSVPGFVEAQRMTYSDAQMTPESLRVRKGPRDSDFIARAKRPTKYCVMYKIVTGDLAAVYDDVRRREKKEAIKISQAADKASEYSYTFRVIAPMIEGKTPPDAGVKPESYYVFVFNTPLPGREDEFNKWYNEEHGQALVKSKSAVPGTGYTSGQRMVLDNIQLNGQPTIDKYLILYRLITPDVDTVFKNGQQRLEQEMKVQPQVSKNYPYDETTDFNLTYRLLGPTIERK